jgi:Ca2+:H+ antiporter
MDEAAAVPGAAPRARGAGLPPALRAEWVLPLSLLTALAFLLFGNAIFATLQNPVALFLVFLWLFLVVLFSALSVVRHAEAVAARLGEPYGTLILTLSITGIEIIGITAVMTHGGPNPTLVRDTLFSVIMIILNGMVGLSLLFGAWRNREQQFNLQSANAYLGVVVPLATFALVMPNFTQAGPPGTYSLPQQTVLVVMSVGLYVVFLVLQTGRHRGYFREAEEGPHHEAHHQPKASLGVSIALLLAYLAPVVFLVDQLAQPIDYLIETLAAPAPLGGLTMALLVATPEATGAVRAARANNLQRSVNIFLGSVLSTIGLTVPAMLVISQIIGRPVVLGLEHTDIVMLVLTLATAIITFASGRTNILQGAVHTLLFVCYVLLIFEG